MTDLDVDPGTAGWTGEGQPWDNAGAAEEGVALFEGDRGQLGFGVRRALVVVLKKKYVSAERDPELWRVLAENRADVEARLNELFLQLVVDHDYGVAYKRQAMPGTGAPFPTLLQNRRYSREETILMVHLRGVFRSGRSDGEEAVFVDGEGLADELAQYRPPRDTNHVEARRAAERAVEALARNDILLSTTQPGRYRISPVIEVLLPVGRLQELADALAGRTGDDATPAEQEDQ